MDPFITDEADTTGRPNGAPSPPDTVLVVLSGCDGVIIHDVTNTKEFAYSDAEFACSGEIAVLGPKGVPGTTPRLEEIGLTGTLHADGPERRIEQPDVAQKVLSMHALIWLAVAGPGVAIVPD